MGEVDLCINKFHYLVTKFQTEISLINQGTVVVVM
jgi:hypothetical protein